MKRFEGKLAVISGGASGMGAATAKGFTSEGGSVISKHNYCWNTQSRKHENS